MNPCDVVVVGAGPVGLWVASELKLAGLEVTLLERRCEPTTQSRALTVHGRTIELFAMRGIADRFLAEGKPIATGHFAALATRLGFGDFDTRFPFTLFLAQSRTEALLEAYARELGVVILRDHMVEAIKGDNGSGYVVEGTCAQGHFAIRSRAVVGADGRRSVVRDAAGIRFDGHDSRRSMMMGDVYLDHLDGPPVQMFHNERGGGMFAPLSADGRVRLILDDPERAHVATSEPPTLDELTASARRILGTDLGIRSPSWLSRFGDETRLADEYRRGLLFVAGDAAHVHAPAGGQGMNVGLQDAMNLGWKLAAVLRDGAPEALLDSYEVERRPVGAQLVRNTMAQIAIMTGFDPAHLALRSLMSDLLSIPELNRRLAGELSGFDLAYPPNSLPGIAGEGAGVRIPDHQVILADGTPTSIHSLLRDGNWLQLSPSVGARVPVPVWVPNCRVTFVQARSMNAAALTTALLVRPDGYCAGRANAQALSAATACSTDQRAWGEARVA